MWERTHRLGGWFFMLVGLPVIVVTPVDAPSWLAIALVLVVALILVIYSLVIYRRLPVDD